jgi:hypothetical protein
MKKINLVLIATCVLFFLFSFTQKSTSQSNFIGVYGISDSDNSQVKLTIYENGTYAYIDLSNPNTPINTTGKWFKKNHGIELENNSNLKFHDKWKFSADGKIATSRKGMLFYRLIKVNSCN